MKKAEVKLFNKLVKASKTKSGVECRIPVSREALGLFEKMSFCIDAEAHYKCGCIVNSNIDDGLRFENFSIRSFKRYFDGHVPSKIKVNFIDFSGDRYFAGFNIFVDEECDDCRDSSQWKQEHWPDSLLQGSIYCHGLATGFSGQHLSISEIASRVFAIPEIEKQGGELCCSWKTQPIGGCGFYLSGDVTVAANRDVWSHVNKLGERVIGSDSYYWKFLIERREDLDLTLWDHTEFFVVPHKIRGFWVKDWFAKSEPRILEVAKIIEEEMGVKTYIVHRR